MSEFGFGEAARLPIPSPAALLADDVKRLVDALPGTVAMYAVLPDGQFRLLAANRSYVGQENIRAAIGKRLPEFLPQDFAERLTAQYRRCVQARRSVEYEEHRDLPGGRLFWRTALVPVFDAEGAVARLMAVTINVTPRKRIEREVMRRQDELQQLAAGVARELERPLDGVRAQIIALRDGEVEPGEWGHTHDAVLEGLDRMQLFIQALHQYAQARTVDPERIDLGAIVEDCLLLLAGDVARKGLVLSVQGTYAYVSGDRSALTEAMLAVLRNALHFSPQGGNLAIKGQVRDGVAALRVVDDGPGFAAEVIKTADRPFTTTRGGTGRGLGLSVASDVLRAHRGGIAWRNRPSAGAEVDLWLPMAEERDA